MPKNKIPRIHNEKLSLTMYKPVTQVAWGAETGGILEFSGCLTSCSFTERPWKVKTG